jgi:hypothetical protein
MFAPKYGVDPLFNEGMSYTPKRGVNAGYVALESSKIPYLAKQLA